MSKSRILTELFKLEAPKLRQSLARIKSVSAEDIVQDSFERMWNADSDAIRAPAAYLRQTAHNLARTELRRQRIVPMAAVADPDALGARSSEPDPAEALERAEEVALLREKLEALPEHLRVPLLMAKVEGLSAKEIAKRLKLTDRIVYHRIAEAITRLHIALTSARKTKR